MPFAAELGIEVEGIVSDSFVLYFVNMNISERRPSIMPDMLRNEVDILLAEEAR